MGHSHHHHHNHGQNCSGNKNERRLLLSVFLNFMITAAQITGGVISGSLALLSDALHNLSDGFAAIISYIAIKLGKKEITLQKTFGYQRAEIIAALLNTSILIIISFFLFKEAYYRFVEPQHAIQSTIVIVLGVIGLSANAAAALMLKSGAKESLNIKSAYLHLLSDAVTSLAVILGGILMYYFSLFWLDPLLTVLIGVYVLKESLSILKETLNILMGNVPTGTNILEIQADIEKLPEVANLHHVHIWCLNDQETHFSGHIDIKKDLCISSIDPIRLEIEKILQEKYQISHATLQLEFNTCENKGIIQK